VDEDDDAPRPVPARRAGRPVEGDVPRELGDTLRHQVGDDAEPVLGGAPVAVRVPDDGDVQRRLRLYRPRVERDLDVVARPGRGRDRVARPQPPHGVQLGVHELAMGPEVLRREDEVCRVPSARHAESDAAVREVVHNGPLLGDPHRVVQRQHDGPRVEPDPVRPCGECRGQDGGVGEQRAEGVEVPLRQPERVKAVLVGELRGRRDEPVLVGRRRVGVVAEEIEAEVAVPGRSGCRGGRSGSSRRGGCGRDRQYGGCGGGRRLAAKRGQLPRHQRDKLLGDGELPVDDGPQILPRRMTRRGNGAGGCGRSHQPRACRRRSALSHRTLLSHQPRADQLRHLPRRVGVGEEPADRDAHPEGLVQLAGHVHQ